MYIYIYIYIHTEYTLYTHNTCTHWPGHQRGRPPGKVLRLDEDHPYTICVYIYIYIYMTLYIYIYNIYVL